MRYITIALAKGRLTELSISLLEGAGIDCTELKSNSRKLILTDEKNKIRFFLAKPADVPVYVEYGAADRHCRQGYPWKKGVTCKVLNWLCKCKIVLQAQRNLRPHGLNNHYKGGHQVP